MKRVLSTREKIMVLVLACLVFLTIVVVYVVMPGLERLGTVSQELNKVKAQQVVVKSSIRNKNEIEDILEKVKSEVNESASAYYAPMEPEAADVIISGMISRYNFTPVNLDIIPSAEVPLISYADSKENSQDGEINTTAASEERKKSPYSFTAYEMTITAEGTGNQFPAFCAEVCSNPSMSLKKYNVENVITDESVFDAEGNVTSTKSKSVYKVSVTIQLFSYESDSQTMADKIANVVDNLADGINNNTSVNNGNATPNPNTATNNDTAVSNNTTATNGTAANNGAVTQNGINTNAATNNTREPN